MTLAAELILAVWIIVSTSIRSLSPFTKSSSYIVKVDNQYHHLRPAPACLDNVDVLAIDAFLDLKAVFLVAEGLLLHTAHLLTLIM